MDKVSIATGWNPEELGKSSTERANVALGHGLVVDSPINEVEGPGNSDETSPD